MSVHPFPFRSISYKYLHGFSLNLYQMFTLSSRRAGLVPTMFIQGQVAIFSVLSITLQLQEFFNNLAQIVSIMTRYAICRFQPCGFTATTMLFHCHRHTRNVSVQIVIFRLWPRSCFQSHKK